MRREVIIDYRPGAGIRMAPHFYNTMEDMDRFVGVIGKYMKNSA